MKIETQYDIGDMVWVMDSDKPLLEKVLNWAVNANNGGKVLEYYYLTNKFNAVPVEKLFSTKEQLIASL